MKKIFFPLLSTSIILFAACTGGNKEEFKVPEATKATSVTGNASEEYDPNRGHGIYGPDNLVIKATLNEEMAARGEKIFNEKCATCHKLTADTLKGPGWKGLTERRTSHWLMNYIVNPDSMLDKDPKLVEAVHLTQMRMPNMKLSDQEARDVLEFMRKNDGVKP